MSSTMHPCKITVLKRTLNQDLIEEYLDESCQEMTRCERFEEGQEFVIDQIFALPEGFCAWAWADIRQDLLSMAIGGNLPGVKQSGLTITGCTDWFRPVIFKVERIV